MERFNVKRTAIATLVGVAGLAVVIAGKVLYDDQVINAPLKEQANRLTARQKTAVSLGLVLHPDEYDKSRKDRLALYDEFIKFDERFTDDKEMRRASDEGWPYDRYAQLMHSRPGAVEELMAASRLGNVDVPIKWGRGVSERGPNLAVFSRYVDAACALSAHALDQGDTTSALEFAKAGARFSHQVLDEPTNKAYLTWSSSANRVLRALYVIIEHDSSEQTLKDAKKVLALLTPPTDLRQAVFNECLRFQASVRAYDGMTERQRSNLQLGPLTERIEPPTGRYAATALESRSLAYWIEAANNSGAQNADLRTTGRFLDNLARQWIQEDDPSSYMARAMSGTFEQIGVGLMRSIQIWRLVSTTVTLLEHKNEHGAFPPELPQDTPLHRDPFEDVPFHYTVKGKGFVLLATGESEEDTLQPPVADLRLVRGQGYALTYEGVR